MLAVGWLVVGAGVRGAVKSKQNSGGWSRAMTLNQLVSRSPGSHRPCPNSAIPSSDWLPGHSP